MHVDPALNIPRYREAGLDSCGERRWASLDQTAPTEGKFSQLEKYNPAHAGYEAQSLSDAMLKQASQMNTLSRRVHAGEKDIVTVNLHRARAHNAMCEALGFTRKPHPWLAILGEDTGERFLFDYIKELTPTFASVISVIPMDFSCVDSGDLLRPHLRKASHDWPSLTFPPSLPPLLRCGVVVKSDPERQELG